MSEKRKKQSHTLMPNINVHAAGIDIGSKSHFIAVGQNPEDVKEFGINTLGHKKAVAYLKEKQIETIAMESTGSYWQTLFAVLQEEGFKVLLVPGNQTKNGIKKTDVKDCQHIQKLHMLGLLTGCFQPTEQTMKIRNLSRHRGSMVEQAAKYSNKIQKVLRLMNIRLDDSVRDPVGKTGMMIIEAILAGQRDANVLVQLVDCRVKKKKEEILLNLQGQWNDELLYELKDCVDLLKLHNKKIDDCDKQIDQILSRQTHHVTLPENLTLAKKQEKGKHACKANLSEYSYKLFGVDLMEINGIGPGVLLNIISEIGLDIHKFTTAKHFCSWLRLAPNNRITGGKVISSKTEKSKSILSKSFKDAANAIGLSKKEDSLSYFFRKIAYKKGRGAAIKATAKKIATIVYKMITEKKPYQPLPQEQYIEQLRLRKIKFLRKDMLKFNITNAELAMC
jgi:transposase